MGGMAGGAGNSGGNVPYIGLDLGTSAVKVVLVGDDQVIIDQESASLNVSRPRPLWSEQDPEDWWKAADTAMRALKARRAKEFSSVRGLGLSGQMHGATLLGSGDRVLRPAILWNDGRSGEECAELEKRVPALRTLAGNIAMPGFTAPKLVWVAKHEPATFAKVEKVLLPKDYLRLRMCGNYASDMSDSAGTLWMDVAGRDWSDEILAATGLKAARCRNFSKAPRPPESCCPMWPPPGASPATWSWPPGAGTMPPAPPAWAWSGPARPSSPWAPRVFTSYPATAIRPNPDGAVHTFCHCLPGTWHRMSVILSAASCLSWVVKLTGAADEASLLAEIEAAPFRDVRPIFLPYLSGERTPHNDPMAQGVFFGLTHETTRAELGRAVLEGVAYAFADGQDVLTAGKTPNQGGHPLSEAEPAASCGAESWHRFCRGPWCIGKGGKPDRRMAPPAWPASPIPARIRSRYAWPRRSSASWSRIPPCRIPTGRRSWSIESCITV